MKHKITLVVYLLFYTCVNALAQNINTYIGDFGDGGNATACKLSAPNAVTVDKWGNIYISDYGHNTLRKVDPSGVIKGFSGFTQIIDVATDTFGNVFIADTRQIRKMSPSGVLTRYAGNGSAGFAGDGGLATAARTSSNAIATDQAGNLYISDYVNYRIRKVSISGIISTIAGNGTIGFSGDGGPATAATLSWVSGICVDNAGNIYFADNGNNRIRKINTAGIISTVAGNGTIAYSGDGGPATAAGFNKVKGLETDASGNVYIADIYNNVIRKVSTSGIITTVAGVFLTGGFAGDGGPATAARFNEPTDVACASAGDIYVADHNNNRIRKINPSGTITTVAGCNFSSNVGYFGDGGHVVSALLHTPCALAYDTSFNLYIGDLDNVVVRKVNAAGIITTVAGNHVSGYSGDGGLATNARLYYPTSVTTDKKGNLFISDDSRIRRVDKNGYITTFAGGMPGYSGDGGLATAAKLGSNVSGVASDKYGNIYVADWDNHRIRKIDTNLLITTVAGSGTPGYFGDGGPATNARIDQPNGVSIDTAGNIFISDYGNQRIRRVSSSGIITTVAGGGSGGLGGLATFADIGDPLGVYTDNTGQLYITSSRQAIYKVDTGGIISIYAGNGSSSGGFSGDGGPATNARLDLGWGFTNMPAGVVKDKHGQLFLTDVNNNRIRVVYNAKVSITASDDTLCTGMVATFSAAVSAAPLYSVHYQWYKNGLSVGADSINYTAYGLVNADIITCSITDGIAGPIVATSNQVRIAVYAPASTPSFSIFTPSSVNVCVGTTVTCSPMSVTYGGTSPSYQWYKNGLVVHTGASYIFTPVAHDTIKCKMTSSIACLLVDTAMSNSLIFNVTTPAYPSATISSGSSTSVCAGTSVNCNVSSSYLVTSAAYKWYKNGVLASTGSNYSFIPISGDSVYCTLTTANTCVLVDTARSNTLYFTTVTPILPTISIWPAGTTTSICPGNVTCSSYVYPTGASYKWYLNGVVAGYSSTYTFAPNDGDTVTCKLISYASCVVVDTAMSNALVFSVHSTDTAYVTIKATPDTVNCQGTIVTCNATPVFGGTSPLYYWYKNGIMKQFGPSPIYTFTPASGDSVSCILYSSSSCVAVHEVYSNLLNFALTTPIPVSASISATPSGTLCRGATVTINATPVNGGSSPLYAWYVNGSLVTGTAGQTLVKTLNSNTQVYCKLTSDLLCASPNPATSNIIDLQVVSPSAPKVSYVVDPGTTVCVNVPVTCTAAGTNTGSSPVYDWFLNNDFIFTGNPFIFDPADNDVVYCRLTSNSDCVTSSTVNSTAKSFTQDSLPNIVISASPANVNFKGTELKLTAMYSAFYSQISYQWVKNGVVIPGATNYNYVSNDFSIWDSVYCIANVSGTCSGIVTSNPLVIQTFHSMTLYPNPNNGHFIINGNNYDANGELVNMRIYNSIGKLVYEKSEAFNAITFYTDVDLGRDLPPGVYMLKMSYSLDNLSFVFVIK